ncbi:Hypothetical protein FKW44_019383 [Caligus rogercresseyi]|uniref:Uncharacterized protein n=1 Tax=Caligus rogercresseyi TaxID=217165 RepID=A0A7T8GWE1_CALRO|nr:Hypothetical protein FKW44_019383 [Caligus rogercresseyi]
MGGGTVGTFIKIGPTSLGGGPESNGRRYPQHALIHLSFRVKIWVELACWITQSQL